MVHQYGLAQCCWCALNIRGGSDSHLNLRFNAGSHSSCRSCCGCCWRCHYPWCCALHHCDILCHGSLYLCIGHHRFDCAPLPTFWCAHLRARTLPCLLLTLVGWASLLVLLIHFYYSPVPPWWPPRSLPTATECDEVSFTVRAPLLCVAAKRALHCTAPHDVACIGAGAVRPLDLTSGLFAAALAVYVP
jgi:hypothetical protein